MLPTLPKSCPNEEIFWSVFFRIWTEYGKIRTRKTVFGHFSHTAEKKQALLKSKNCCKYCVYILLSLYLLIQSQRWKHKNNV